MGCIVQICSTLLLLLLLLSNAREGRRPGLGAPRSGGTGWESRRECRTSSEGGTSPVLIPVCPSRPHRPPPVRTILARWTRPSLTRCREDSGLTGAGPWKRSTEAGNLRWRPGNAVRGPRSGRRPQQMRRKRPRLLSHPPHRHPSAEMPSPGQGLRARSLSRCRPDSLFPSPPAVLVPGVLPGLCTGNLVM